MSNKGAKQRLIKLYGKECFIDKLKLRTDPPPRYTGKAQMHRMKQLTYHHIQEKSKGGKATVENGAILSNENHIWFNKQEKAKQAQMNQAFQDYKSQVDRERLQGGAMRIGVMSFSTQGVEQAQAIEVPTFDDPEEYIVIPVEPMTPEEQAIYEEHKRARNERVFKKFEGYDR